MKPVISRTSLLDIFFDTVRVKHEQQPTSSALFCETALTVSADDKSKKRRLDLGLVVSNCFKMFQVCATLPSSVIFRMIAG